VQLLKVHEVAAELRVSRHTVYDLVRSGALPAVRLGPHQTRISKTDLDAWLAGHAVTNEE